MGQKTFVVKLHGGCNLRCTYCYYIDQKNGKGPHGRKRISRHDVFAALDRIAQDLEGHHLDSVSILWHGGEPLLCDANFLDDIFTYADETLAGAVPLHSKIQSNLTLLSEDHLHVLKKHKLSICTSIDGPAGLHDSRRVDARGRGTYARVVRNLERCRAAGLDLSALSVVNPKVSGRAVFCLLHDELLLKNFDFLLPDSNRLNPPPAPLESYSRFLIEAFDAWVDAGDLQCHVNSFESILRSFAGMSATACTNRGRCREYLSLEVNGHWGVCDTLRGCGQAFQETLLTPENASIAELEASAAVRTVKEADQLPSDCRNCSIVKYCRGGCAQGRWDGRSLMSTSVWCRTYFDWISHMYSWAFPGRPVPPSPGQQGGQETVRQLPLYPVSHRVCSSDSRCGR